MFECNIELARTTHDCLVKETNEAINNAKQGLQSLNCQQIEEDLYKETKKFTEIKKQHEQIHQSLNKILNLDFDASHSKLLVTDEKVDTDSACVTNEGDIEA